MHLKLNHWDLTGNWILKIGNYFLLLASRFDFFNWLTSFFLSRSKNLSAAIFSARGRKMSALGFAGFGAFFQKNLFLKSGTLFSHPRRMAGTGGTDGLFFGRDGLFRHVLEWKIFTKWKRSLSEKLSKMLYSATQRQKQSETYCWVRWAAFGFATKEYAFFRVSIF